METDTDRYIRIGQSAWRFAQTVHSDLKSAGLNGLARSDFDRIVDAIVKPDPTRENYRSERAFRRATRRHRPV